MSSYKLTTDIGRERVFVWLLLAVLSVSAFFVSWKRVGSSLDWLIYDTLQSTAGVEDDGQLLIIEIDEYSLNRLGRLAVVQKCSREACGAADLVWG